MLTDWTKKIMVNPNHLKRFQNHSLFPLVSAWLPRQRHYNLKKKNRQLFTKQYKIHIACQKVNTWDWIIQTVCDWNYSKVRNMSKKIIFMTKKVLLNWKNLSKHILHVSMSIGQEIRNEKSVRSRSQTFDTNG